MLASPPSRHLVRAARHASYTDRQDRKRARVRRCTAGGSASAATDRVLRDDQGVLRGYFVSWVFWLGASMAPGKRPRCREGEVDGVRWSNVGWRSAPRLRRLDGPQPPKTRACRCCLLSGGLAGSTSCRAGDGKFPLARSHERWEGGWAGAHNTRCAGSLPHGLTWLGCRVRCRRLHGVPGPRAAAALPCVCRGSEIGLRACRSACLVCAPGRGIQASSSSSSAWTST